MPRQVSLLSCRDVFVSRICIGYNCSVDKKIEFKRGEDVIEKVQKIFYLGDMISCYRGPSEAVSARIASAWKKFRELSSVLVWKQGLFLKQRGKIYHCYGRQVLLYCCERSHGAVADEARLRR